MTDINQKECVLLADKIENLVGTRPNGEAIIILSTVITRVMLSHPEPEELCDMLTLTMKAAVENFKQ